MCVCVRAHARIYARALIDGQRDVGGVLRLGR